MTRRATHGGSASTEAPGDPVRPARERILEAADRLFYQAGIRAIGVEAVVERAGVTKMSLYRNFASKDELVAAYLEVRDRRYWQWWETVTARHPDQPAAQILALLAAIAKVAVVEGYRGCPFTNATIEFPDPEHPGRRVAVAHKREMRRRFRVLAAQAGAAEPERLGDQLSLLAEGAYASSQSFGSDGPAPAIVAAAGALLNESGFGASRPLDAEGA